MPGRKQLLAELDSEVVVEFKIELLRESLTYRDWLDRRVREYIAERDVSRANAGRSRKRLKAGPKGYKA
jgi:hypothetical protein